MSSFFDIILSFPTVPLTFLLGLVVLYWLLVILGALDIDLFHSDVDAGGGADIGGEVWADVGADAGGDIDVGADAAIDAGSGGDGAVDGAADSASGGAVGLAALLQWLGLRGVPVTILGSFWFLFAWILSVAAVDMFRSAAHHWLVKMAIFAGAMTAGLALLALVLRPFRRYFAPEPVTDRRSLVGKTCTIVSQRVDAGFGQARIEEGSSIFEYPVRCMRDNRLKRGSCALVIDYDARREWYLVIEWQPDPFDPSASDPRV